MRVEDRSTCRAPVNLWMVGLCSTHPLGAPALRLALHCSLVWVRPPLPTYFDTSTDISAMMFCRMTARINGSLMPMSSSNWSILSTLLSLRAGAVVTVTTVLSPPARLAVPAIGVSIRAVRTDLDDRSVASAVQCRLGIHRDDHQLDFLDDAGLDDGDARTLSPALTLLVVRLAILANVPDALHALGPRHCACYLSDTCMSGPTPLGYRDAL